VKRKRGSVWYVQYRLPDGRQVQKKLGPAWTGGGRPPAGFFTKRTAERALRQILADADRGVLPGTTRTGATVKDAVEEWLRYVERERGVRATTVREYRSSVYKHVVPVFGSRRVESVTTRDIEHWKSRVLGEGKISRRTVGKLLTNLNGIFQRAVRVYGLTANPVAGVERLSDRYDPGKYFFYSPEDVRALVRAAEANEDVNPANAMQDGVLFLTAAFTGLRLGEVLALRWRDVDFANETIRVGEQWNDLGQFTQTKGGLVRSVPLVEEVAQSLARLGTREYFTGEDNLVFVSAESARRVERAMNAEAGDIDEDEALDEALWIARPLDRSAVRKRFKSARDRAGLRPLRFHDLRHTFGSLVINEASTVEVQEWLGHADARTTARYLHYKSRAGEAKRIAAAFQAEAPGDTRAADLAVSETG